MVDIHSHIIFDIDDGSRNIEESLKMIRAAKQEGVETLVATPHFHKHILNAEKTKQNFSALVEATKEIDIELKLGYEITLNPLLENIVDIIADHKMGESRYILVEFPYFVFGKGSLRLLDLLRKNNFRIIISHPERNGRGSTNKDIFLTLKEKGYYIQINAGSIVGAYGSSVKKMAKYLIRKRMADFVASDAHRENYFSWLGEARDYVVKWSDESYANKIFRENGKKIWT